MASRTASTVAESRARMVNSARLGSPGLGDRVAEQNEFALDAAMSPRRVLVGEAHDQLT